MGSVFKIRFESENVHSKSIVCDLSHGWFRNREITPPLLPPFPKEGNRGKGIKGKWNWIQQKEAGYEYHPTPVLFLQTYQ